MLTPHHNGSRTGRVSANNYAILRFLWFALFLLTCCTADSREVWAGLRLSWVDSSSNESGFEVERRNGTTGPFVRIITLGPDQNFYSDDNVEPGSAYCYRVRAFNASGASGYSNEACATASFLLGTLENPEQNQPLSGVALVRGWGFDSRANGKISGVELLIDGALVATVPCCSPRGDVRTAFPQFPAFNTENSGWGAIMNWGLLGAGSHTVQVQLTSLTGETLATEPRTVTVVRPGDFSFLDQFSLAYATASIVGDELVVEGIIVRDQASQQQRQVNIRFRWFANSQSLGMVEAITTDDVSSAQAVSALLSFSTQMTANGMSLSTASQSDSGLVAVFESPEEAQAVAGIGLSRGWAFAEQSTVSIAEVRLLVDGMQATIPCCSARVDVATAYPQFANALHSGWGITLNYGLLSPGFHLLETQIRASNGETLTLSRGVTTVRIGGFEFLDRFDFSHAAVSIQDGALLAMENVNVRDKASGQTALVDVFFQWAQSTQALGAVASYFSSGLSPERP